MILRCFHALLRGAAFLFALLLMLWFPDAGIRGIVQGLHCCAGQIIPALFPFFVLSAMLLADPAARWLGMGLRPVTLLLGIRSRRAPSALLMSWLGGFAVAARCVSQLYEEHALTDRQAQCLLIAGAGSSPAFVVNAVGLLMLGSSQAGFLLLGALLAANGCCAMLFRLTGGREPLPDTEPVSGKPVTLADAVRQAVDSTLTVCGFILFFHFILGILLPLLPDRPALHFAAACLLEVTAGCRAGAADPLPLYACCAALSLLSLSVLLQIRALLSPQLSLRPLILSRLVHLPLALLFLRAELLLWPVSVPACSTLAPRVFVRSRVPADAALLIFLLCCTILHRLDALRRRGAG